MKRIPTSCPRRSIGLLGTAALLSACSSGSDRADLVARELLKVGPHAVVGAAWDSGQLRLAPGTQALFVLDLAGPSELRLEGAATRGSLEVTTGSFSTVEGARGDGTTEEGRSGSARRRAFVTHEGNLEGSIDLIPEEGRLLAVRLGWPESAAGVAEVTRLELREPRRERTPIVLFSIDTLAADHTSLLGYARATTPHLERLAEESVTFEHCLANAPFTSASYNSQFTGLLPESTWIDPEEFRESQGRRPRRYETWHVPRERWTLAEHLKAAGYRTAAFVDNPMASPSFGFDQGFEFYDMSAQEISIGDPDGGVRKIVPMALDWMSALGPDEPFFLFVNVLDIHGPYNPPEGYRGHFDGDEVGRTDATLPVSPSGEEIFGAIPTYNAYSLTDAVKKTERLPVDPLVRLYDEEILFADDELHGFTEALRERGLLDRMALVVTSDHGEVMGDGDFHFGHGVHVESNLHVPLVVRLPGGRAGGTRVSAAVQLVDLFPTCLDLAGSRALRTGDGVSLAAAWTGGSLAARPHWSQGGLLQSRAVTEGRWRLVETPLARGEGLAFWTHPAVRTRLEAEAPELYEELFGAGDYLGLVEALERNRRALMVVRRELVDTVLYQLFDLEHDRAHENDVAGAHPEVVNHLRALLAAAGERSAEARRALATGARAVDGAVDLEELRSLGYAGED